MLFISDDDVAAFAKRERAHRTRLAGLMAFVLALALSTILPTFKSQITSITSDSRLLGRNFCGRNERDDCPTDPNKTKPGICDCGVADTDTDGDGTPDCKDGCPHDASKTTPGACGCGIRDTNTDTDGDGMLDCNDGCPRDASKTSPGACGCGIPDTDTDGDGTPDCKDGCPRDASKTSYSVCGCGVPDTDTDGDGTPDCHDHCPRDAASTSPSICGCGFPDTDADGDGTPDCHSDCIDNDPSILSFCERVIQDSPNINCEGCGGKYIRVWKECGLMCLSNIDYCLDYSVEWFVVYVDSLQEYRDQSYYVKVIQTGADSSNSVLEVWDDCQLAAECVQYIYLNAVPCSQTYNDTADCLVCDDGNEYCNEKGILPFPSNPWFGFEGEADRLLYACFGQWDITTPSELEMKPLSNKFSQYAHAFFNHGA